MPEIEITKVVCGEYMSNAYILREKGSPKCVLIDVGDDYAPLKTALNKLNTVPEYALLTHGHFDHIMSAARVRDDYGAKVLIHPLDFAALSSPELCALPEEMADGFDKIQPDCLLEEGDITLCGIKFTVIHTPGHTPGCVCLFIGDDNIMFTGDTLFADGFGRTDLPGGDWAKLYGSLRSLLALDGEIFIYPGHGSGDYIKNIKKLFKR